MNTFTRILFYPALLLVLLVAQQNAFAQTHVTAPGGRIVAEWWYAPSQPGWGLVLTHSGTQSVVLYTGFDASGKDVWQVGVGPRSTQRFQADLIQTRWNPVTRTVQSQEVAGHVDLMYYDEDNAAVELTQGTTLRRLDLKRIVSTRQSSVDDYSGLFVNPLEPGFGLALLTQGPVLAVLATAYDAEGYPRWWMGYKLSQPNSPAPFPAKRFRQNCVAGNCTLLEAVAGTMSIQPRHERELSANLALGAGFDDGTSVAFTDRAVYMNLGEPTSGRKRISDIRPFHSEAALNDYLQLALLAKPELPFDCLDFSPLPPGASSGPAGAVTNTQVADSAEADIIARSLDLVVHRVPSTVFISPPIQLSEFHLTRISGQATHASTLRILPQAQWQYAEQVLALPAVNGEPRFALLSSNRQTGFALCCPEPVTVTPKATVSVIRVRPDGAIQVEWQYTVDARAGSLRRHGDTILFLSNTSLLQTPDPGNPRTQLLRPRWSLNQGASQPLLLATNTWVGGFEPGIIGTTVATVHRIPMANPAAVQQLSIVTNQANLYASADAIYLASNRSDPLQFGVDNSVTAYRNVTNVQKLSAADLSWRGSADVRGSLSFGRHITWGLHDTAGDLRVITSLRDRQAHEPETAALLTVLREDAAQQRLIETVTLPNANRPEPIGRAGESLHAVRVQDQRAQVAVFSGSNAVYDIDLSNRQDPRLAGTLPINIFSDLLLPLPSGQLLGFGSEVNPNGSTFFAPEAFRVTLFDPSPVQGPLQARQNLLFGGPTTQAPLLREPQALSSVSPEDGQLVLATAIQLGNDDGAPVSDPLSVLRLRYDAVTSRLLEARNIPAELAPEAETAGLARTVLYGDQLYLFYSGAIFGDRIDSTAAVLQRIDD